MVDDRDPVTESHPGSAGEEPANVDEQADDLDEARDSDAPRNASVTRPSPRTLLDAPFIDPDYLYDSLLPRHGWKRG